MSAYVKSIVIFVVAFSRSPAQATLSCGKGQRVTTGPNTNSSHCELCPEEQFMPFVEHVHTDCFPCEKVFDNDTEVFVSGCNRTHNAVITCTEGFYRTKSTYPDFKGECKICKQCQFPKRACQKNSDTICCPGENYELFSNKCVQYCGPGQYTDHENDTCLPCQENSFMDKPKHYSLLCMKCSTPNTSEHERILQPCNRTHETVLSCENGYYRSQSEKCLKCQNCKENTGGNTFEARVCTMSHDTVCCPHPNMGVSQDGVPCTALSETTTATTTLSQPVCGEGEYLYTISRTHSATCLPCPEGTFMNETAHTRGSCISCGDSPHAKFCPRSMANMPTSTSEDVHTQGGIVGGVVGVVVVVLLIVAVLWFWRRRRMKMKKKKKKRTPRPGDNDGGVSGNLISLGPSAIDDSQPPENDRPQNSSADHMEDTRNSVCHDFKSTNEFSIADLPDQYHDIEIVEMVKLQAQVTVRVDVAHSSERRPKFFPDTSTPYPFSDERSRNESHTGSGWIERVMVHKDLCCLCETCLQSTEPMMSWGEIVICTAARVVFDINEGRNSRCHLFYDTHDTDLQSCPSVSGAMKVFSDIKRDLCYMTFVTHNMELLAQVQELSMRYREMRHKIKFKYGIVSDGARHDALPEKLWKLHSRYKHSLDLLNSLLARYIDLRKQSSATNSLQLADSLSLLQHLLVTINGVKIDMPRRSLSMSELSATQMLRDLITNSRGYKTCKESVDAIKELYDGCRDIRAGSDDEADALVVYRRWCLEVDTLDRCLHILKQTVCGTEEDGVNYQYPKYKPRYNASHPLAIVISHLYGGYKMISLGKIIGRKGLWCDFYNVYRYTNLTTQGSEGALVFVMGNTGLGDLGHSGCVDGNGESGAWSDILPYLADLSCMNTGLYAMPSFHSNSNGLDRRSVNSV